MKETVLLGYYSKDWYVASEFGYAKYLLAYIVSTDYYKTNYYQDAKDGWYGGLGGKFQVGLQGGYTFLDKLELSLRTGIVQTEGINNFNPSGPPMYADLGVAYLF